MPTIEIRRSDNGDISYRCKVRVKGFKALTKTFTRKNEAELWGYSTEAEIRDGRYSLLIHGANWASVHAEF